MAPYTTPEPGDIDMWAQILNALGRMVLAAILSLEKALPLIIPGGIAAYLFGKHFGYRDAALRLFVMTGIFVSVVGTPVALNVFGLDINIWETAICCTMSAFCIKGVKWAELWIMKRLGIDRRSSDHWQEESKMEGPE